MMRIIRPSSEQIDELQRQEKAYYWSNCAELFFAKHGLLMNGSEEPDSINRHLQVVLRGAKTLIGANDVAVYEGPLDADLLGRLKLRAKTWKASELDIFFDDPGSLCGKLVYGTFATKRIPTSSREKTYPKRYTDPDPLWRARPVRVQFFESDTTRWTPVLFAGVNNERQPIAMTDGASLVLGVPLFDIIGFNHAMPALSDGFYKALQVSPLLSIERWLRDQLIELSRAHGIAIEPIPDWPGGDRGCLSVRHDYDRDIPVKRLGEILEFYSRANIKATWFLQDGKPPPVRQAEMMVEAGHEIALHTIASSFTEMQAETRRFRERYGLQPKGFTCHGGIGSRGHLALHHNRWAIELGMMYGEFIGRCRGFPHPLIDAASGRPELFSLILQNCHHSLDLTTKPEDHQLDFLSKDIPRCLDRGEHVIIMNHPDIHWRELRRLLEGLDTTGVWKATLDQAAEWTAREKYNTLFDRGRNAIPSLC